MHKNHPKGNKFTIGGVKMKRKQILALKNHPGAISGHGEFGTTVQHSPIYVHHGDHLITFSNGRKRDKITIERFGPAMIKATHLVHHHGRANIGDSIPA